MKDAEKMLCGYEPLRELEYITQVYLDLEILGMKGVLIRCEGGKSRRKKIVWVKNGNKGVFSCQVFSFFNSLVLKDLFKRFVG